MASVPLELALNCLGDVQVAPTNDKLFNLRCERLRAAATKPTPGDWVRTEEAKAASAHAIGRSETIIASVSCRVTLAGEVGLAEKCPVCYGNGVYHPPPVYGQTGVPQSKPCHGCGGSGWVTVPDTMSEPKPKVFDPKCHG